MLSSSRATEGDRSSPALRACICAHMVLTTVPPPLLSIVRSGEVIREGVALDLAARGGAEDHWRLLRDYRITCRQMYLELSIATLQLSLQIEMLNIFLTLPFLQAGERRLPPTALVSIYHFLSVRDWDIPVPASLQCHYVTGRRSQHASLVNIDGNNRRLRWYILHFVKQESDALRTWMRQASAKKAWTLAQHTAILNRTEVLLRRENLAIYDLLDRVATYTARYFYLNAA